MSTTYPFGRFLGGQPTRWALLYVAVVLMLLLTSLLALASMAQGWRQLSAATDNLTRLEGHAVTSSKGQSGSAGLEPAGPAFLEGPSRTIAGAALLQRTTDAITRAGGTLVSSEIDPQSKDNAVRVVAACELAQSALQEVLYELEAGKPLLFVDQLFVQPTPTSEGARLRVSLGVTGQWESGQ